MKRPNSRDGWSSPAGSISAAKTVGLDDGDAAFGARVQAIWCQYKEFSKAAGLPEQLERTHVYEKKDSAGKRRMKAKLCCPVEKIVIQLAAVNDSCRTLKQIRWQI